MFQFEYPLLWQKLPYAQSLMPTLKQTLICWQKTFTKDGWNALFTENHNLPRSVSIYGSDHHYWV